MRIGKSRVLVFDERAYGSIHLSGVCRGRDAHAGGRIVAGPQFVGPDTARVLQTVIRLAVAGQTFSSDDVHAELERTGVVVNGNAIGGGIREALVCGLVVQVGETRSKRPEAHGRRVDLLKWKGLVSAVPSLVPPFPSDAPSAGGPAQVSLLGSLQDTDHDASAES